jgi:hypothetical protein
MFQQKSILKLTFLMIWVFNFTSSFMLVFALLILKNKISWINTWHILSYWGVNKLVSFYLSLSLSLFLFLPINLSVYLSILFLSFSLQSFFLSIIIFFKF